MNPIFNKTSAEHLPVECGQTHTAYGLAHVDCAQPIIRIPIYLTTKQMRCKPLPLEQKIIPFHTKAFADIEIPVEPYQLNSICKATIKLLVWPSSIRFIAGSVA